MVVDAFAQALDSLKELQILIFQFESKKFMIN